MNPNDLHYIFPSKQTAHLLRALEKAGEGAQLHVYPRDQAGPLLVVVDAAKKQGDPINESHPCPPECD